MKGKYTIIPNVHIRFDDKLESDKLLLYLILMQNRTSKDICIFSIRELCNRLDTTTRNTNRTKYIIDTLKYFEEKDIFFFSDYYNCKNQINIEQYSNGNKLNIIYAELMDEITGDFTIIYDDEVDLILEICQQNNINKYNMVHLYLYILSFIKENKQDEDYKLAYPSINNISEALGLSEYTILKYIKVLKEQNILYYDSIGYKIVNGEYKMTNTYYCRIEDKDILNKFIEIKRKDKSVTSMSKKDKNTINLKRSLKQKINKLYKKQNKTQEEIDKLKDLEKEYEQLQK